MNGGRVGEASEGAASSCAGQSEMGRAHLFSLPLECVVDCVAHHLEEGREWLAPDAATGPKT